MRHFTPLRQCALALGLAALLSLSACDQQRMSELTPGVSTQAEVEAKWGPAAAVWDGADGMRIFEYNRQPAGHRNYQIHIGPDGVLQRIDQVLNERNFDRIQVGMRMEEVRPMLGQPAKQTTYDLQGETHWVWRYLANNQTDEMIFTVVFDSQDMQVKSTSRAIDPRGRQGNLPGPY